jgi:hypothetical protein
VIYLLIPLIVAGCLLLGHELLLDRDLLMKLTPKGHGGSDAAKPSPSQQTSQPNLADAAAAPQQEAHGKAGEDGHCPAREPSSDPTVTKDQA